MANTYFITKLFVNLHSRMVYLSISTGSKSFHRPMKWINQSPQLFCSPKINQYIAYWIFFFKTDIIQLLGHFPPLPPPKNCQLSKAEPLLGKNMKYTCTCRIKQKQSLKLCWYIQCITSFFYHNIHILASIHKKWVIFRPLQSYHLCVTKTIQATKFLSIEKHSGIRLP